MKQVMILTLTLLLMLPVLASNKPRVIHLTEDNMIFLNTQVDNDSVADVIMQLRSLDRILKKDEPIYLVLYTPGGSVIAGMDIVTVAQSLNRPVHTLTIFAASMGFVIAQHLDERYILQNGILMSHRMSGGVKGEVGGEMDEMLRFMHVINIVISKVCAERLDMNIDDYLKRISDEWWLYGQNAVDQNAADEVVNFSCSDKLIDTGRCPL